VTALLVMTKGSWRFVGYPWVAALIASSGGDKRDESTDGDMSRMRGTVTYILKTGAHPCWANKAKTALGVKGWRNGGI